MSRRGNFIWEELWASDTASAAKFYGKLAGLKAKSAPQFGGHYTTLSGEGGPMGGVLELTAEHTRMRPGWLSFIGSDDVDETTRHTESLGGSVIVPPVDIGTGSRAAVLRDPQGALFASYASLHPYEPSSIVPLGAMYWHELITTDYQAAFRFYEQLFGWKIANDMPMGDIGVYRVFGTSQMPNGAGGIYTQPQQQPGASMWLPYIKVANVEKATGVAKSLGAQIMHGPADVPGGRITSGVDPQGSMFAIYASVAPPAKVVKKRKKAVAKKRTAPKKKAVKKTTRKAGSKK